MTFGLTENGFRPKRLDDIKTEIENSLKDTFGAVDVSPESVFGQIIGIFAKEHADLWEQMDTVYKNQHPSEAAGVNLDYILEFTGLTRLTALQTQVSVGLKGTLGINVPQGTQIRSTLDNALFELKSDTEINKNNQLKMYVRIDTVLASTNYTITIDGTTLYQIASGLSPTQESIALALVNAINIDLGAVITASHRGNGDILLLAKAVVFGTDVDANMSWFSPAEFQSVDTGEILAIQDTLTIIETPVGGLDEVNNFEDGVKGRDAETDAEANLRRILSLQIVGAGTLPAIIARVQDDISGVTEVKGFENRTDIIDGDGRPPHSFQIIVDGGDNQAIGNLLWQIKPAGIQTYGSENVNVIDSNGDIQVMHFSRPVSMPIYVKIILTLYSEEIFPVDGVTQVKSKTVEYGNSLDIGADVIPQRFYGGIFQVPGIETIDLQISLDDILYVSTPITIAPAERATFDLTRVSVTII